MTVFVVVKVLMVLMVLMGVMVMMVMIVMIVVVVVMGMTVMVMRQRAVNVRDATVEVFVGLSYHSPANQHPHIAEKDGERVGVAFLRQCFGRNEEAADCYKRRSDTRGGGDCELSKVACHTFLLPKPN